MLARVRKFSIISGALDRKVPYDVWAIKQNNAAHFPLKPSQKYKLETTSRAESDSTMSKASVKAVHLAFLRCLRTNISGTCAAAQTRFF